MDGNIRFVMGYCLDNDSDVVILRIQIRKWSKDELPVGTNWYNTCKILNQREMFMPVFLYEY